MDLSEFRNWLRNGTNLSESSISVYIYAVNNYLSNGGKIELDSMNKWISENSRDKHNNHYKYALKKYLQYIGKRDLILDLVKTKIRPRDKVGNYHSPKTIFDIIGKMEFYRPVALMQYTCGARAREALSLDRDKIVPCTGGLKVIITAKGGHEDVVVVPTPFSDSLKGILDSRPGKYPFLRGENTNMTLWLNTNYRYYLRELRCATFKAGIKFTTHDFRRNYAEEIKNVTGSIYAVKVALRHARITSTEQYMKPTIGSDVQAKFAARVLS